MADRQRVGRIGERGAAQAFVAGDEMDLRSAGLVGDHRERVAAMLGWHRPEPDVSLFRDSPLCQPVLRRPPLDIH